MSNVETLLQYGYLLLFAFVLAEQSGLPVPAGPRPPCRRRSDGLGTDEHDVGVRRRARGVVAAGCHLVRAGTPAWRAYSGPPVSDLPRAGLVRPEHRESLLAPRSWRAARRKVLSG